MTIVLIEKFESVVNELMDFDVSDNWGQAGDICQLLPLQHLVDTVSTIIADFCMAEQTDNRWITGKGLQTLGDIIRVDHELAWILEHDAICEHTDCRMGRIGTTL